MNTASGHGAGYVEFGEYLTDVSGGSIIMEHHGSRAICDQSTFVDACYTMYVMLNDQVFKDLVDYAVYTTNQEIFSAMIMPMDTYEDMTDAQKAIEGVKPRPLATC